VGDARAIDALAPFLLDNEGARSSSAAEALEHLAHGRAVEPLLHALAVNSDPLAQTWIARALGVLGDRRSVEPLIGLLDGESDMATEAAAEALGRLGDQRAVGPLVAIVSLSEDRFAARWFESHSTHKAESWAPPAFQACWDVSARALEKIAGRIGLVRALTSLLLRDEVTLDARRWAASRLRGIDLSDLDAAVRDRATEALARMPSGTAADYEARLRAAETSVAKALISRLRSKSLDPKTRRIIERRLSVQAVSDLDPETRGQVSTALAELAVDALIEAGRSELEFEERKALANKVAAIGPPAVGPLQRAVTDESRLVRRDAARILGRIGGAAAVASLRALLDDDDPGVQEAAGKALRGIGGAASRRPLAMPAEHGLGEG
jgi:HEAT repeat protein